MIELLRESVLVQAAITLICVGGVTYLAVTGQPIPEIMVNAVMLILGFYFGSKSAYAAIRK